MESGCQAQVTHSRLIYYAANASTSPPPSAAYYYPFPTLTGVRGCAVDSANSTAGCSAGAEVVLSGEGLTCGSAVVYFSGYYCTSVAATAAGQLSCTLPALWNNATQGTFALAVYVHRMWTPYSREVTVTYGTPPPHTTDTIQVREEGVEAAGERKGESWRMDE